MTTLWFELTARTPAHHVEAVAALLRAHVPSGVSVEEPIEPLGPERGFRRRDDLPVLVRAYVPSSELGAVVVDRIRAAFARFPEVELTARPIYEQDWQELWRSHFGIVRTAGRVVIAPSWIEYEPADEEIVLRIDPGQAFGTGHHETTRLCLAAIGELVRPGMRVLDVGTGSGILAIAAARCGASVTALDLDPVAVAVARENASANGVADRIEVLAGSLEKAWEPPVHLAVANIHAEADAALAPLLAASLQPGGRAVLSGFVSAELPAVRSAAERAGLRPCAVRHEGCWCLLEAVRA